MKSIKTMAFIAVLSAVPACTVCGKVTASRDYVDEKVAQATNSVMNEVEGKLASATPSDYETVSNRAMNAVSSVNGKTGTVTLVASDVGALPNSGAAVLSPTIHTGHASLDIGGYYNEGMEGYGSIYLHSTYDIAGGADIGGTIITGNTNVDGSMSPKAGSISLKSVKHTEGDKVPANISLTDGPTISAGETEGPSRITVPRTEHKGTTFGGQIVVEHKDMSFTGKNDVVIGNISSDVDAAVLIGGGVNEYSSYGEKPAGGIKVSGNAHVGGVVEVGGSGNLGNSGITIHGGGVITAEDEDNGAEITIDGLKVAESISNINERLTLQTAPVTSVNSKTGAVEITATDVGAVPSSAGDKIFAEYVEYNTPPTLIVSSDDMFGGTIMVNGAPGGKGIMMSAGSSEGGGQASLTVGEYNRGVILHSPVTTPMFEADAQIRVGTDSTGVTIRDFSGETEESEGYPSIEMVSGHNDPKILVNGTDIVPLAKNSWQRNSNGSFVVGNVGIPPGMYAFANGNMVSATNIHSHAEGNNTIAGGPYSHAEGNSTRALGMYSHSEGKVSDATGDGAHAEGHMTTASGNFSHADGFGSCATNNYSYVWGGIHGIYPKSHGDGTYNINPEGGLGGFYIGDSSLSQILSDGVARISSPDGMRAIDAYGNVIDTAGYPGDFSVSNVVGLSLIPTGYTNLTENIWVGTNVYASSSPCSKVEYYRQGEVWRTFSEYGFATFRSRAGASIDDDEVYLYGDDPDSVMMILTRTGRVAADTTVDKVAFESSKISTFTNDAGYVTSDSLTNYVTSGSLTNIPIESLSNIKRPYKSQKLYYLDDFSIGGIGVGGIYEGALIRHDGVNVIDRGPLLTPRYEPSSTSVTYMIDGIRFHHYGISTGTNLFDVTLSFPKDEGGTIATREFVDERYANKSAISATDETFSNAVLAVGLNIDTNYVDVLNEISSAFGGFPIEGTATTVGGLLAALAAAIAWLKRNKADKADVDALAAKVGNANERLEEVA